MFRFRLALSLLIFVVFALAQGQAIRIGVVVDSSGPGSDPAVEAALAAFADRSSSAGGVFGAPFEILVRDSRSDPSRVREEITRLVVEDEVHAIVCCESQPSASAAEAIAEEFGVMTLTLAPSTGGPGGWTFGLGPSERTALRAVVSHAYAEGKRGIGLMTLDNPFGDLAQRVLEEELPVAEMELVVTERYPPDASVLTPEALWVATRLPGAIVVWGLPRDTAVAVEALRRRGYGGPVYARPALLEEASGRLNGDSLEGTRFPVAPIVADLRDVPEMEAARNLSDMLYGLYGVREVSPAAARVFDALTLLRSAAEQAAVYGVPPTDTQAYRFALRDAAVALPPLQGAGGAYDLDERNDEAVLPVGLVMVELREGAFVPVTP